MTRLQRYRAFLAAMNPSSDPRLALERGYYVERPDGGVWSKLTKRLELDPASTHLVLGGIGSGKTSELLRTKQQLQDSLRETGDLVEYRDVSKYHNLAAAPKAGVLLALTAMRVIEDRGSKTKRGKEFSNAAIQIIRQTTGYSEWVPLDDDDDYDFERGYDDAVLVHHPGVIEAPPDQTLPPTVTHFADIIKQLTSHDPGEDRGILMLFDSLDRLPQTAHFKTLVIDDVRALKSAGIGVVIVGPARFMVGHDRSVTDIFDYVYYQLATDPSTPEGQDFLIRVLRQRSNSDDILSDECLPALAQASGGVLRDLISLTKLSAEEAYASGHPQITAEDVTRASDAFGRSLALGLDDEQLEVLEVVAKSGSFVVRGERELSLLETRRVLMYPPRPGEVSNRWAVHPTLLELMNRLAESRP